MRSLKTLLLVGSVLPTTLSRPSHRREPEWTPLANITVAPRQEHTTFFLPPNTIGILGGIVPNGTQFPPPTTDIMQFYSISSNAWITKAPIPRPLNHVNAAVSGGKIYVLGGLAVAEGAPAWRAITDSWVYDPETDSWASLPPVSNEEARGSAAIGVYDGKIYLAGGMKDLELFDGGQQTSVTRVSIFDTKEQKWLDVPEAAKDIPAARDHAGAAVIDGKMYVLGGRDHGQENVRATVFILDLCNLEAGWKTSEVAMPTARGGVAAGVIDKKVYTFGGEGNTEVESGVFNNTEVYDTVSDTWKTLSPMRMPRHGTYAVGVGDRVYIPGGGILQGAGPVADFDAFTP